MSSHIVFALKNTQGLNIHFGYANSSHSLRVTPPTVFWCYQKLVGTCLIRMCEIRLNQCAERAQTVKTARNSNRI